MNKKTVSDPAKSLERSMRLLIEIITIVIGFAFVIALTQFFVELQTFEVRPFAELSGARIWLFVVVITTLIRFYHGNTLRLTENYSEGTLRRQRMPSEQLFIDFVFLFVQSTILVGIGFFESTLPYLYWVFILLFAIDVLWILLLNVASRSFSLHQTQTRWLLANVVTLTILLFMGNTILLKLESGAVLFSAIIIANCFADYSINWNFYFPSVSGEPKVIFVAAPFTNKIKGGKIDAQFELELQSLIQKIQRLGFDVLSSHIREQWGDATPSPDKLTSNDYDDIVRSDILVVYIDETPSFGVHIELGWASAMGKPTVVAIRTGVQTTPLIEGLKALFPVSRIIFENGDDLLPKLENELLKIRTGLK